MKRLLAGVAAIAVLCGGALSFSASADTCPYDCDVNQDGMVSILDAITLNQYLAGLFYVSNPSVMDVDGNHIINVGDSTCVTAHTVNVSYTCYFS